MMHRRLFALVAVAEASVAQPVQPIPAGSSPSPQQVVVRREVPPPQRAGTSANVPLQLTDFMPTLAVTVNGQGPYRMIVDTGAGGYLRMTPRLASALGLTPVGEARAADPSGKNPVTIKLYNVDSLKIGDVTYSGVSASSFDFPNAPQTIDGVLGIGLFRDLLLTLDYGKGRLGLADGALPAANGRDIVDVEAQPTGLLVIPVQVGNRTVRAHLDTGNARQPLFLPESDAKAIAPTAKPKPLGVARTVSQEVQVFGLAISDPVRIGSVALPVHQIAYPSIREPNIGSRAFAGMSVTVDWSHKRLKVAPSAPTGS